MELSDAIRNAVESPSGEAYLRLGQLFQQEGRLPKPALLMSRPFGSTPNSATRAKPLRALNQQINKTQTLPKVFVAPASCRLSFSRASRPRNYVRGRY